MASPCETEAASVTGRARKGFALETVLMLLIMFSVIILAGLSAVTTGARTSDADYRGARASYAAEGGADDVISQLHDAMSDGVIGADELSGLQTPAVSGYRMTKTVTTIGSPVARTITSGPYAGLYSLNQPLEIAVVARDSSGSKATAVVSVNALTIPLFQFGVFYENDLEILNGPPMTFAGWVHTNGNLYLSSNNSVFQSLITTPDSVFWDRKELSLALPGVHINNIGGTPVALDFDSRSHSDPAFRARSQSQFDGRLMSGAFGVTPLRLPLPSAMPPATLVLPRNAGDSPSVRAVKMAWKADWYVTVKTGVFQIADTTVMKAQFCDSLVIERPGGLAVPSSAACARIFKPRVNAFYEGREDTRPDLVDIHLDSLRLWADSAPANRSPRVLYIEFTNPTIANNANDYLAVRVRGGDRLPRSRTPGDTGGLSMVTSKPMYVLGDYNTNVWRPASLMADAVTFLSNPPHPSMLGSFCAATAGWCDDMQQDMDQRVAAPTTVQAAILAGHSPTPCDYSRSGCVSPPYGGGVENFPRFLENWNGVTLTYTGSLVSLFFSSQATGLWGNSVNAGYPDLGYYTPPNRLWSFDTNFRFPDRLPPGAPSVGTVLQTAFRPLY